MFKSYPTINLKSQLITEDEKKQGFTQVEVVSPEEDDNFKKYWDKLPAAAKHQMDGEGTLCLWVSFTEEITESEDKSEYSLGYEQNRVEVEKVEVVLYEDSFKESERIPFARFVLTDFADRYWDSMYIYIKDGIEEELKKSIDELVCC